MLSSLTSEQHRDKMPTKRQDLISIDSQCKNIRIGVMKSNLFCPERRLIDVFWTKRGPLLLGKAETCYEIIKYIWMDGI